MGAWIEQLSSHKGLVVGLTIGSVVMFVGSLLAVPWLIARAPRDFFVRDGDAAHTRALPLAIVKNLVGVLFLLAGILMLLLPGQGVMTVLVGLALLDLPGKHALLQRLAKRPSVLRALNYVRQKTRREPFDAPQ